MIADSIQAQLDEAEHVIRQQMARITELENEVAALKANASAHQTLKNIYANPAEPTGHRIRAAQAALPHEEPKLQSVPPALDLAAEEVYEPLADVIARQRARMDRLQGQDIEVLPSGQVRLLKPSSNGGGDDHS
jgi:hypothetical protein